MLMTLMVPGMIDGVGRDGASLLMMWPLDNMVDPLGPVDAHGDGSCDVV